VDIAYTVTIVSSTILSYLIIIFIFLNNCYIMIDKVFQQ